MISAPDGIQTNTFGAFVTCYFYRSQTAVNRNTALSADLADGCQPHQHTQLYFKLATTYRPVNGKTGQVIIRVSGKSTDLIADQPGTLVKHTVE